MKILKYIPAILSLASLLLPAPAKAQNAITRTDAPLIVPVSPTRSVSGLAGMAKVKVAATVDYTISSDASWLTANKVADGVIVNFSQNPEKTERTAAVTLENAANAMKRTITIIQDGTNFDKYVETPDMNVRADSAKASEGADLKLTTDGRLSTYYTYRAEEGKISAETPLVLSYYFSGEHIDKITFNLNNTTANGYIGKAKLSWRDADSEPQNYKELGNYNLSTDGKAVTINLSSGGIDNVKELRFEVYDGLKDGNGHEDFACAEMNFAKDLNNTPLYNVFANSLLTKLRHGVTQKQIEAIENPFVRNLAQLIYTDSYDTTYRTGWYRCLPYPESVGDSLVTGRRYDLFEGVTGIMVKPGTSSVIVANADESARLRLYVTAYRPKPGKTGPEYDSFDLKNGINVINYTADSVGLAYVAYNSDTPDDVGKVGVHLVSGIQNGYVTPQMSNDSIGNVLRNAKYMCMDMLGERVHLVFECKSLLKYTDGQYRRLINIYDTIINWTHRLIGAEKYHHIPINRTLFYVNYDYFMYQTVYGASAKYDVVDILQPSLILNSRKTTLWGIAHEWGHQHQMTPYMTWAGLGEVSNNMHAGYATLYFGENADRLTREFSKGYDDYFVSDYYATHTDSVSHFRKLGYDRIRGNSRIFNYSPKMREAYIKMKDHLVIPSRAADYMHSATDHEGVLGNRLASIFLPMLYFDREKNYPDMIPDLYESLRRTDVGNDKYELIAAAQNAKVARWNVLKAKYPNSCWVKNKYVCEKSKRWDNSVPYILNYIWKLSTTTGYNMMPYCERWGMLRTIAMLTDDDYGEKYYCLTEDMYDEFKADMDARVASGELKVMPENMLKAIVTYPIPQGIQVKKIPN